MFDVNERGLTRSAKGRFFVKMWDAKTGEILVEWNRPQVITLDAGIQAAGLFKNSLEPTALASNGIAMLAIGTGAAGNPINPDAPDERQRALNIETTRKAFSSSQFRTAAGVAVAYPTNIVDFTTVYGEAEAVGALNEMALIRPATPANPIPAAFGGVDYDATFDTASYDLMANYLTFGVITKPSTAILSITWRLTF